MLENKFYVYKHVRLDTEEVFYIGKGHGRRARRNQGRSKHWHNIVNKHGYRIEFVDTNLSEAKAFELEMFYINFIGRRDLGTGTLINKTDGGEGNSGRIVSIEHKKYLSNLMKGKKHPMYGTKRSKETRRKIHEAVSGDNNKNLKPVVNQFGETFVSIGEAQKYCNLKSGSGISSCLNGIYEWSGKHPITREKLKWKYL